MVIAFGNRYIGKMQAIQAKSQAIAEFALTIKPLCKNRRFRLIQIRFEFLALINCLLCKRLNMFYPFSYMPSAISEYLSENSSERSLKRVSTSLYSQ